MLLITEVGDKFIEIYVFKPEIDNAEKLLSKFVKSVDVVNCLMLTKESILYKRKIYCNSRN